MSAPSTVGPPHVIVVMGVAGCGKSTIAALLAGRLGWRFAEADDFHSPSNVAIMAAGSALTDTDRAPWVASLRDWIDGEDAPAVLTCSALRRSSRDVLRTSRAQVRFVLLSGVADVIGTRLAARAVTSCRPACSPLSSRPSSPSDSTRTASSSTSTQIPTHSHSGHSPR